MRYRLGVGVWLVVWRWHRVNPGVAPRVAAQNSFNRKPTAAERPMAGNGFIGVVRTPRVKATAAGGHQGDDHQLIGADRAPQHCLEKSAHLSLKSPPGVVWCSDYS